VAITSGPCTKANHGPLLAAAQAAFTVAGAQGTLRCTSTEDDANDRVEHRCGYVLPLPATAPAFPGLVAFGRIDSVWTKRGGKTKSQTQYVVMSQRLPAWRMLSITRRHWSVENHLHRQLDVVFREDDARTRKDNARAIYRSFDAWHWTSCGRTRCHAPSPAR